MTLADAANPLVPAAYDLVGAGAVVLVLCITIVTLISLFRTRFDSGLVFLGWFAVVFFLPIIGAVLWFSSDRRKTARAARL